MKEKQMSRKSRYHFIHLGNLITIRAENRVKANFKYNKLMRGEHKHAGYHCMPI